MDAKGHVLSDKCIAAEVPFVLPEGWAWARFGEAIEIATCLVDPLNYQDMPHIAPDNIQKGTGKLLPWHSVKADKVKSSNHLFSAGQILYSKIRPALRKAVIAPFDGLCSADMYPLNTKLQSEYVLIVLLSNHFTEETLKGDTRVKMPKTNQKALNVILIPIPPLAEQRRIVERVDRLMPLVEEYGELEDAREALDAGLPARLRRSVLQEAVQGRLVPQDPSDEPAAALLRRIREQRAELAKQKGAKLPKGGESVIYTGSDGRRYEKRTDAKGRESEPVCIEDEIPFEVPESWEWARLGSVAVILGGATPDKGNPNYWGGSLCWASMKDIHGDVLEKTLDHITQEGLDSKASISVCHPGDLVVSTRLIPGKSIISRIDSAINQDLKIVRSDTFEVMYLHLWFQSMLERFKRMGSGTTVPGIKLDQLSSALIPVPPRAEQRRIAGQFELLVSQMD